MTPWFWPPRGDRSQTLQCRNAAGDMLFYADGREGGAFLKESAHDAMVLASQDEAAFAAADVSFHTTLASCCGNQTLEAAYRMICSNLSKQTCRMGSRAGDWPCIWRINAGKTVAKRIFPAGLGNCAAGIWQRMRSGFQPEKNSCFQKSATLSSVCIK